MLGRDYDCRQFGSDAPPISVWYLVGIPLPLLFSCIGKLFSTNIMIKISKNNLRFFRKSVEREVVLFLFFENDEVRDLRDQIRKLELKHRQRVAALERDVEVNMNQIHCSGIFAPP